MRNCLPLVVFTVLQASMPAQAGILSKFFDKISGKGVYSSFGGMTVDQSMQEFGNTINNKYGLFLTRSLRAKSTANIEKVAFINNDNHTQIVPQYRNDGLYLTFQYDEVAAKNPELMLKDLNVFTTMTTFHESSAISSHKPLLAEAIGSVHSWVETHRNAAEGSLVSKSRLQDIELELLRSNVSHENLNLIAALAGNKNVGPARLKLEIEIAEKKSAELRLQAQTYLKKQQKALDKWREETGILKQYESAPDKLNDLILKNDRAGVARMLEAYLPWAIMEPGEINAWKIWLEAIEFPDSSKTTLAFRGLEYRTDKVQRLKLASGEQAFGFMSTVLTQNQGNYSRRLRSLTTNRIKNGDVGISVFKDSVFDGKITDQMSSHAKTPMASSFLSFTYSPRIAAQFIGRDKTVTDSFGQKTFQPTGGFLAVQMDSRRLIPNLTSMYGAEIELLAPLIIFPDEVVAYKEGQFRNQDYTLLMEQIAAKTGRDPKTWEDMAKVPASDVANYQREGYVFLKTLNERPLNQGSCRKVFN